MPKRTAHLLDPPNPLGLCWCGCGETTPISKITRGSKGLIAGQHVRYVFGHFKRDLSRGRQPVNPSGLCQCGCEQPTTRSGQTDIATGAIRGEFAKFIRGHQNRGRPLPRGVHSKAWKGGRTRRRDGYICVRIYEDDPLFDMAYRDKKGHHMLLEHRMVMAQHVGRPLRRTEVVHHKNGDRADNRLENLQLLTRKTHTAGQAYVCLDCGSHRVEPTHL